MNESLMYVIIVFSNFPLFLSLTLIIYNNGMACAGLVIDPCLVNQILKMIAFWDIVPSSLVEVDRCFRGA
jgi:hypothetical protein